MEMTELKPITIKIWTMAYFPFIMGGDVWQSLSTEVEALGPFDLGQGHQGYLVEAPNGDTLVAEATTGAIIGPSLEQVREDIREGDSEMMQQQVAEAAAEAKNIYKETTLEDFWKRMKKQPTEAADA